MLESVQVERVIRHLLRFGSSPADAEDLAQEALVIAWRKDGDRDRDRSLDGWLYGIARNVYRNHSRNLRRRAEQPIEVNERGAYEHTLAFADVVAVRDAIRNLPEDQQDIVILHELEEYTLKETAALLAVPFYTAKDRLRRARAGLRRQLQGELAEAVSLERCATRRIAKASAPLVVVGVLASLPRSAVAGTGAHAAASWGAFTTGGAKLGLVALFTAGLVVGVVAHYSMSSRASAVLAAPALAPVPQSWQTDNAGIGQEAPGAEGVGGSGNPGIGDVGREANVTAPASARSEAQHAGRAKGSDKPPAGAVEQEAKVRASVSGPSEAPLVEVARVALRRGRAEHAVRALMAHERRFPTGQLAEERDVLLVEAYLAAGNLRLANMRLAHYRALYPLGLHRQRADHAAQELARRARP